MNPLEETSDGSKGSREENIQKKVVWSPEVIIYNDEEELDTVEKDDDVSCSLEDGNNDAVECNVDKEAEVGAELMLSITESRSGENTVRDIGCDENDAKEDNEEHLSSTPATEKRYDEEACGKEEDVIITGREIEAGATPIAMKTIAEEQEEDEKNWNDDKYSDAISDITEHSQTRDEHGTHGIHVGLSRTQQSYMAHTHQTSHDSAFPRYPLLVDLTQNDRAVEIIICSMKRPHMRAFHLAWISFFVAFFLWFSASPLLMEIAQSLNLSKKQIWNSSVLGVTGSAILRIVIGPLCDKFGARLCISLVFIVSSVPTLLFGLVHTSVGLCVSRFFIGFSGACFVTSVFWTSTMFTREVAGTANALAAGWGNLGGGAAHLVMGSMLFPLFKYIYGETSDLSPEEIADKSWRSACIIPGIIVIITAFFVYFYSDDSPKGNYKHRVDSGLMVDVDAREAFKKCAKDWNTWILCLQYGCCFGVEITVQNAAALYFEEEFGQSTESAAAIASIFGWMNLFARGLGGFASDVSNAYRGMRGRLVFHTIIYILEGVMIIVFSFTGKLGGAISTMVVFSIFVQMAEGSTFGIVPYVNPRITGSISGLVGAGGNVGGIIFSILFRNFPYRRALRIMGACVIVSAFFSSFIFIRGESILCRQLISEFHKWVHREPSIQSMNSDSEDSEDTTTPVVKVVELRQQDSLSQDSLPSEQRPTQNEKQNENFITVSAIDVSIDAVEETFTAPNSIVISPNAATATVFNSKEQDLDTNVHPGYGLSQSISLDRIQHPPNDSLVIQQQQPCTAECCRRSPILMPLQNCRDIPSSPYVSTTTNTTSLASKMFMARQQQQPCRNDSKSE